MRIAKADLVPTEAICAMSTARSPSSRKAIHMGNLSSVRRPTEGHTWTLSRTDRHRPHSGEGIAGDGVFVVHAGPMRDWCSCRLLTAMIRPLRPVAIIRRAAR